MHSLLIALILFLTTLLSADLRDADVLAATEGDPSLTICELVNALTGDCVVSREDLFVPGVQPISLRRSYLSGDGYGKLGGWEFFPHTKLQFFHRKGKRSPNHKYHRVQVIEPSGTSALFSYQENSPRKESDYYILELFNHGKGVTNTATGFIGARTHIKNAELFRDRDTEVAELIAADGTVRKYVAAHYVADEARLYVLESEHLPNGNWVLYTYDRKDRITEICTQNPAQTITYAWAKFIYEADYPDTPNFSIHTSDGRTVEYKFKKYQEYKTSYKKYVLSEIISPEAPKEEITYHPLDHKEKFLLSGRNYPNGRGEWVDYFQEGYDEEDPLFDRVQVIYGPNATGEKNIPLYTFRYHLERVKIKKKKYEYTGNGSTEIFDALGNKTEVRFDTQFRPTAILVYEGTEALSHQVHFTWDGEGQLLKKSLVDAQGNILWKRNLSYDTKGNVLLENNNDYLTYSTYDSLSRRIREEEENGKITYFTYLDATSLPLSKILCDRGKTILREFYEYNDDLILVKTITDDGSSMDKDNLADISFRKIVVYTLKKERPAFGFPETIEERYLDLRTGEERCLKKNVLHYNNEARVDRKEIYDAEGRFSYRLVYTYDDAGRILEETNSLGHTASTRYDDNGNKIYGKDFSGKQEYITYDYCNRPVRIEEVNGTERRVTEYRYDAKGNRIATIDPQGNTTTFTYNALGQIIATTLPDGATLTAAYDPCGRQTRLTTPEGHTTLSAYNIFGKPTKITHPDQTIERYDYDIKGNLTKATNAGGTEIQTTYDAFDRETSRKKTFAGALLSQETFAYRGIHLIGATDPEGYATTYTHDFGGRKIAEERAGKKTSYTYDALGRIAQTQVGDLVHCTERDFLDQIAIERKEDSEGRVLAEERYTYDAAGNRTAILKEVDGQASQDQFRYDLFGRLTSHIDPRGSETTLSYNDHFLNASREQVLQKITTDPEGVSLIETYNTRGKLAHAEKQSASGKFLGSEAFTYDQDGNCIKQESTVVSFVDGSHSTRTLERSYDFRGNVTTLIQASGTASPKITRFTYTPTGLLHLTLKPSGITVEKTYDGLGRLIELFTSDKALHYRYTYNGLDHLLLMEDCIAGKATTRNVDPHGSLTFEKLDHGLYLRSAYDILGRRTELLLPDSSSIVYRYDALYLREVERNGKTHRFLNFDLSGNLLLQEHLDETRTQTTYEPGGRLMTLNSPHLSLSAEALTPRGHVTGIASRMGPAKRNIDYIYDDLEQILEEQGHKYAYDSQYNRLKKDTSAFEVDAFNQITSKTDTFTYDLNGNLTTHGDQTYHYDALDRLIALEKKNTWKLTFTYDGLHRRLTRSTFIWENEKWTPTDLLLFLYDDEIEIGSAASPDNILDLHILASPSFNSPTIPLAIELRGETFIPLHDLSYNTCALAAPGVSTLAEFYQFSAFGEEEVFDGDGKLKTIPLNPWRFAGKRKDILSGLINFAMRDYDPELGRWITPDPAGSVDTLNLYAFVRNNSLSFYDALGLDSESIGDKSSIDHPYKNPVNHYAQLYFDVPHWKKTQPQVQQINFESQYPNHPRSRLLSTVNRPEPPGNIEIGFINGIDTTIGRAFRIANYISDLSGGFAVHLTYNASQGRYGDFKKCALGIYDFKSTEPARLLHQQWDKFFDGNTPDARYLMFAHSGGAIHLMLALLTYDPERRKQIHCVCIAPGGYVFKDTCASVIHYRVSGFHDMVPHFDKEGSARASQEGTVEILSSKKGWFGNDHGIDGEPYQPAIERQLANFIKFRKIER